jgi:PTS system nitrogen regulatory IIA component
MVELVDILRPDNVLLDLDAGSKRGLLHELAEHLGESEDDVRAIYESLMERERLGSTGVGRGIAIPHAVVPGVARLIALFARLNPPIEFDAVDDRPVDLVFLLLSPDAGGSEHLKALARVARLLHAGDTADELRRLKDPAAVHKVLVTRQPTSHAA